MKQTYDTSKKNIDLIITSSILGFVGANFKVVNVLFEVGLELGSIFVSAPLKFYHSSLRFQTELPYLMLGRAAIVAAKKLITTSVSAGLNTKPLDELTTCFRLCLGHVYTRTKRL